MGVSPEEDGHRPSACIRAGFGVLLRPLLCNSLAIGGRLLGIKTVRFKSRHQL